MKIMNKKNNIVLVLSLVLIGIVTISFIYKTAENKIKIVRDGYGVPSIYADTTYDLFFGYGYVVAQDRLFQMEMIRRSSQGIVSEVLGEKYINFDLSAKRKYDPVKIRSQIAQLNKENRAILEGYANGMNKWITSIKSTEDLPYEFKQYDFKPEMWTSFDVAMVFIGTMVYRYSDFNTELDNIALLGSLITRFGDEDGESIFNQLKWRINENAIPTIVDHRYSSNQIAKDTPKVYANSMDNQDNQRDSLMAESQFLLSQLPQVKSHTGASNVWLIGKERAEGVKSILVNGPQFGMFDPAYVYTVGLHGAGFDLVGSTPFAYPCILFGTNKKIAWGSTAGFGDTVDFFKVKTHKENKDEYFYDGIWKKFGKRSETIRVKDGRDVTIDILSTVHGTVELVDRANNVAYVRARTWEGKEVSSLFAWVHQARANDWKEWTNQAKDLAISINWYYTDREGNIGYVHAGHFPDRHPDHDSRIPADGSGNLDWKGIIDFKANPKVYNPKDGYLVNWNNTPIAGYNDPDMMWWKWGPSDRVTEINTLFDNNNTFTPQQAWDIIAQTSQRDVNHRPFVPLIKEAFSTSSVELNDKEQKLFNILVESNGSFVDNDKDGTLDDPAPYILSLWLSEMLQDIYRPVLDKKFMPLFIDNGYHFSKRGTHMNSFRVSTGAKTLYNVLTRQAKSGDAPEAGYDLLRGKEPSVAIIAGFRKMASKVSLDKLSDIATIHSTYSSKNFFGIPQSLPTKEKTIPIEMNRGTENNLSAFGPDGIISWNVTPPGQRMTLNPDGSPAQHCCDQLELFETYGHKELSFTEKEVKDTAVSEEFILSK